MEAKATDSSEFVNNPPLSIVKLRDAWLAGFYRTSPLNVEQLDVRIFEEQMYLRSNYIERTGEIDYQSSLRAESPFARQYGYIKRFMPANAYLTMDRLANSPEIVQLFARSSRLSIASIGSGPGTDVLGVIKYCHDKLPRMPELSFALLDKAGLQWKAAADVLADVLKGKGFHGLNVESAHLYLDVVLSDWGIPAGLDLSGHDLIICSHLISELYNAILKKNTSNTFPVDSPEFLDPIHGEIRRNLERLFSTAKPGCLILLIDIRVVGDKCLRQQTLSEPAYRCEEFVYYENCRMPEAELNLFRQNRELNPLVEKPFISGVWKKKNSAVLPAKHLLELLQSSKKNNFK